MRLPHPHFIVTLLASAITVGCCTNAGRVGETEGDPNVKLGSHYDIQTVSTELSDLLHIGMSNDEAMDALGVLNPSERLPFIGDLSGRSASVVSPKFPGFWITLGESMTSGRWVVTNWVVTEQIH